MDGRRRGPRSSGGAPSHRSASARATSPLQRGVSQSVVSRAEHGRCSTSSRSVPSMRIAAVAGRHRLPGRHAGTTAIVDPAHRPCPCSDRRTRRASTLRDQRLGGARRIRLQPLRGSRLGRMCSRGTRSPRTLLDRRGQVDASPTSRPRSRAFARKLRDRSLDSLTRRDRRLGRHGDRRARLHGRLPGTPRQIAVRLVGAPRRATFGQPLFPDRMPAHSVSVALRRPDRLARRRLARAQRRVSRRHATVRISSLAPLRGQRPRRVALRRRCSRPCRRRGHRPAALGWLPERSSSPSRGLGAMRARLVERARELRRRSAAVLDQDQVADRRGGGVDRARRGAPARLSRRGPAARGRARPAGSGGSTARAANRPADGAGDEHGVDREAHEHHVDPVRIGQPEARTGRERAPAHESLELAPQAGRGFEVGGEDRASRQVPGSSPGSGLGGTVRQVLRLIMIEMIAGPRMTMNSEGKMHPTSGNSILIGARAASASAR